MKEGTAFFPGSALAGNGLLVSDGDVWRRQRRLSNHAFRRSAIMEYAQYMTEGTAEWLTATWGVGGTRDVYPDYNQLTLDIVLQTLFGASMSRDQGTQVADAIRTAFKFFTERCGCGVWWCGRIRLGGAGELGPAGRGAGGGGSSQAGDIVGLSHIVSCLRGVIT